VQLLRCAFFGFVLVYLLARFSSWSGEAKYGLKIKKDEIRKRVDTPSLGTGATRSR
jgi:hypothetical protein